MLENKRKVYNVYHPVNDMNHFCVSGFNYIKVAEVVATNPEEVFQHAQNHNDTYAELGIRSTSVGDLIVNGDEYFIINGIGFSVLTDQEFLDYTKPVE